MRGLDEKLGQLESMSSAELRAEWVRLTGTPRPRISPSLMRLALAWEIQAKAQGGLSRTLQQKLEQAKQDLVYYRQFVSQRLDLAGLTEELKKSEASSSTTHVAVPLRDDDSHYFQSYAENGG